jgi:hypothetical protein
MAITQNEGTIWDSASGLMAGIRPALSGSDATLVETALQQLIVFFADRPVRAPGKEIWASLCRETYDRGGFRARYQQQFSQLIAALRTGTKSVDLCCDYHRGLFRSCSKHIGDPASQWFVSFLELLAASTSNLHCQYPSKIDLVAENGLLLSRFMRLEDFITRHTYATVATLDLVKRFRDLLSPKFSPGARQQVRKNNALGLWHGRIGSYFAPIGDIVSRKMWCDGIKPFATLTVDIEQNYDRGGSPSRALQKLGLPFRSGEIWIELIYPAINAAYQNIGASKPELAIPTHLESAGNWAFVPDRDSAELTNHARDLASGDTGAKEIVHQLLDIPQLFDAVVWGESTESDWTAPDSPFLLK